MEDRELEGVLEALLFVATEPLSPKRLAQVLGPALAETASLQPPAPDGTEAVEAAGAVEPPQSPIGRIAQALERLAARINEGAGGLTLVRLAGGWQLRTRPEHIGWLRALDKVKNAARLSRSALETLAIAAYRQPLTRAEIEAIRGVDCANVLHTLMERRLIKITGRREGPGRPMVYGTTREFLECFGLNDLSELPSLKDFNELAAGDRLALALGGAGEAEAARAAEDPPTPIIGAGGSEAAGAAGGPPPDPPISELAPVAASGA